MSNIATVATSPMPVSIHGFSVNSAILTVVAGACVSILGYMVAVWPKLRDGNNTRRKNDMDGLRADVLTAKNEAREARDEARKAAEIASRLENMLACMRPAISILSAEVKRLDPGNDSNPALVQVADLMAMAAAGDLGFGKAMLGLASIKGSNE